MTHRVRHLRSALLLLAAAVGLSACGAGAGRDGAEGALGEGAAAHRTVGPEIVFVGDSITQMSTADIEARFSAGHRVRVEARSGEMFRERQAAAAAAAADRPAVAVINLGTNDVRCAATNEAGAPCRFAEFTVDDLRADADRMVALFGPDTCVVAVNPTSAEPIGEHWAAVRAAGRVAGVADWKAVTTAHPEYLTDVVGHLTDAGKAAYAAFLDQEQARICPAATGPAPA